jgi:ribonucleoside-triphosphate reductase
MVGDSLVILCLLLFVDGATLAVFTTPLLLQYGKLHEPWQVAVFGGLASAAGSACQILLLRLALDAKIPWIQRFAPSREKLEAALASYPSASFLALALARATPLPDAPLKLVAAVVRYPAGLYALAVFLGSLPYYFVLALVGRAVKIPTWIVVAAVVAIAAGVVIDRLRRRGKPAA